MILWGEHDEVFPLELGHRLKRWVLQLPKSKQRIHQILLSLEPNHECVCLPLFGVGIWGTMLRLWLSRMQAMPSTQRSPRSFSTIWFLSCFILKPPLGTSSSQTTSSSRKTHSNNIKSWSGLMIVYSTTNKRRNFEPADN